VAVVAYKVVVDLWRRHYHSRSFEGYCWSTASVELVYSLD
jgi:hypothetical protein